MAWTRAGQQQVHGLNCADGRDSGQHGMDGGGAGSTGRGRRWLCGSAQVVHGLGLFCRLVELRWWLELERMKGYGGDERWLWRSGAGSSK
ncbi:hypothetical protein M0R45_035662 [Rubus argutus]|uniref:Uncharacterized protein n=1 Tax=Rubus argutus TaxID=59490 RepID=A0AAW1VXJ5_RUBAR